MAYTKLGRVRPSYAGAWNSGKAYSALEIVQSSGGGTAYIARKDVPAGKLLTDADYWAVVLDVQDVVDAAEAAAKNVDAKANALEGIAAGNSVEIYPDKGSLLKPVLTYGPVMAGSGVPSPTNIRALSTRTGGMLTCNGSDYILDFGQNVYGCTIDWNAGTLMIDTALLTLTGVEGEGNSSIESEGETADICVWLNTTHNVNMAYGNYQKGYCSHFLNNRTKRDINTIRFGAYANGEYTQIIYFYLSSAEFPNYTAFNEYLATQAAAGTPVQVVYPLANPVVVRIDTSLLTAIAGANALQTDAEEMTVGYNKSLRAAFEELKNAIIAMGGNV